MYHTIDIFLIVAVTDFDYENGYPHKKSVAFLLTKAKPYGH
jgi:hypothetical protein